MEAPWPLALKIKSTRKRDQRPDDARIWRRNQRWLGRDTEGRRETRQANPTGADRDLGSVQGQKRGKRDVMGKGGRRRHAEWGAETRGGG